jgi:predicted acyltransferase
VPHPAPTKVTIRRGSFTPAPDGSMRLMSLDALRGFDMFWIAGGGYIVTALYKLNDNPLTAFLKRELTHVDWVGFAFYDLIFPLFVFMVGVSMVFSLRKTIEKSGRGAAIKRILARGSILFLIGIFYSGGLSNEWPEIRLLGVLNRIALAYMAAGVLFVCFRPKALAGIILAILAGYWGLLELVPIRNFQLEKSAIERVQAETGIQDVHQLFDRTTETVVGQYEKGLNLPNHLDFQFLPGKLYDTYWDPEGLLSTIPAVATCLIGVLAGVFLLREDRPATTKAPLLLIWGLVCVVAGFLWGFEMPIIKKIWTSTYVLVAAGYSLALLGVFFQVIEIWRWRAWCQPFVWIGMNSITIYLAAQILNFRLVAQRLFGGQVKDWFGGFGEVLQALLALGVMLWFARFLYRRKIFLRL